MLTRGNEKLGNGIWTFSLPTIETCPGSTELCRAACYATRGQFHRPGVQNKLTENLAEAIKPTFAAIMGHEIQLRRVRALRIHVSGDFFDEAYTRQWLVIATACAATRFYFYSRSWRTEGVRSILTAMSQLENVRAWYSIDQQTGWPSHVPKNVRLAYLQVAESDIPERPVDLVFRDYALRGRIVRRVEGTLVCPKENGTPAKTTCGQCQLCLGEMPKHDSRRLHHHTVAGTHRRLLLTLPMALSRG